MKKLTLTTCLLLMFTGALFAQEGFKFGFRASPMFSFPTVTDSNKSKIDGLSYPVNLGFSFGLMVNYGFSETVGIHTGLHIQTRSLRMVIDSIADTKTRYDFTTLEIPIALKLRSPEIGTGIYIVGLFGGAAEVNVANRRRIDALGVNLIDDKDGANINLITAAFTPGAGVDWEFDWGTIYMGGSYHMGLMNILRKKNNGNVNAKLNSIMLDLGYYF